MFEKLAYAAEAQSSSQVNPIIGVAPLILPFVIIYFFWLRPQMKRQKDLQKTVENLKKGDKVITSGGVIGVITSIQNDYVVIKTGDNEGVKMEVLKNAITGLRQ